MPTITNRGGTIQKTVRFPSDTVAYVEQFQGDNFSDRLLNLIERYQRELPERQEELERLIREIGERAAQLDTLDSRLRQVDDLLAEVLYIQPTFRKIRQEVRQIMEGLPD